MTSIRLRLLFIKSLKILVNNGPWLGDFVQLLLMISRITLLMIDAICAFSTAHLIYFIEVYYQYIHIINDKTTNAALIANGWYW